MLNHIAHLIDDDAAVRAAVQLLLECEGIEVRCYVSGDAFLRAAAPEVDSCLIIDVDMPGIGGIELLDQLRGNGIIAPAIVITGAGISTLLVSAVQRLNALLLYKPFSPQELVSSIKISVGHLWALLILITVIDLASYSS